jgi:hypothetical protein
MVNGQWVVVGSAVCYARLRRFIGSMFFCSLTVLTPSRLIFHAETRRPQRRAIMGSTQLFLSPTLCLLPIACCLLDFIGSSVLFPEFHAKPQRSQRRRGRKGYCFSQDSGSICLPIHFAYCQLPVAYPTSSVHPFNCSSVLLFFFYFTSGLLLSLPGWRSTAQTLN